MVCRLTFRLYATFFVRDKGIAKQFQRTKNVGWSERGRRSRPSERNPEGFSPSAYSPVKRSAHSPNIILIILYIINYSITHRIISINHSITCCCKVYCNFLISLHFWPSFIYSKLKIISFRISKFQF